MCSAPLGFVLAIFIMDTTIDAYKLAVSAHDTAFQFALLCVVLVWCVRVLRMDCDCLSTEHKHHADPLPSAGRSPLSTSLLWW